ncbi:hypothetical protein BDZ91DRAFT_813859 [Kalaharituber pfeilii]|nr:hypothetical protein BDZ91DRAFT_813859 [Kalaharituber pfeilii]
MSFLIDYEDTPFHSFEDLVNEVKKVGNALNAVCTHISRWVKPDCMREKQNSYAKNILTKPLSVEGSIVLDVQSTEDMDGYERFSIANVRYTSAVENLTQESLMLGSSLHEGWSEPKGQVLGRKMWRSSSTEEGEVNEKAYIMPTTKRSKQNNSVPETPTKIWKTITSLSGTRNRLLQAHGGVRSSKQTNLENQEKNLLVAPTRMLSQSKRDARIKALALDDLLGMME